MLFIDKLHSLLLLLLLLLPTLPPPLPHDGDGGGAGRGVIRSLSGSLDNRGECGGGSGVGEEEDHECVFLFSEYRGVTSFDLQFERVLSQKTFLPLVY